MLGLDDSNAKYSKPLTASSVVRSVISALRPNRGGGGVFLDDSPRRVCRWPAMAPWIACLFLTALLVHARIGTAAADARWHAAEESSLAAAAAHARTTAAVQAALHDSELARGTLQGELSSASTLAAGMQRAVDSSLEAGGALRDRLASLSVNLARISTGTDETHAQLRARIEQARELALDKQMMAAELGACHARLNNTAHGAHTAAGVLLEHIARLAALVAAQDAALTETRASLRAERLARGVAADDHVIDTDGENESREGSALRSRLAAADHAARALQHAVASDIARPTPSGSHASSNAAMTNAVDDVRAAEQALAQFGTITQAPSTLERQAVAADAAALADTTETLLAQLAAAQAQQQQEQHRQLDQRQQHAVRQAAATPAPHQPQLHPVTPPPQQQQEAAPALVKELPLHRQPSRTSSSPASDNSDAASITPFPAAYKQLTGRYALLALDQPAEVQSRQQAIRDEFLHAWRGYRDHAWGFDELHPISRVGRNSQYHMGLTMIDALDTMVLMGFEEEYAEVRAYLADHLTFDAQEDINVFETTIRVIGGLLSVHALTEDQLFADKAEECARALLIAFNTPTGLPYGTVGLRSKTASNPSWAGGSSTMAEVASIQLEWHHLTRLTGDAEFARRVDRVTEKLAELQQPLYPQFISVATGQFTSQTFTFGARVDSLYEYLVKQHVLSGGRATRPRDMYRASMRAMDEKLVREAPPLRDGEDPLTFIAEMHGTTLSGKMDHLVCFVPGMLALGAHAGTVVGDEAERHMELARRLMRTCNEMYTFTATGLAPEIAQFSLHATQEAGMKVDPHAQHNLLRPETAESLFVMWRVTKDPIYREWGWKMFEAFRHYCRVPGAGYSGLKDVRVTDRPGGEQTWDNWNDKMESFWLSETLKYLYLLFSPDEVLSLDEWVFNTEAHPLPIDRDGDGIVYGTERSLLEVTDELNETESESAAAAATLNVPVPVVDSTLAASVDALSDALAEARRVAESVREQEAELRARRDRLILAQATNTAASEAVARLAESNEEPEELLRQINEIVATLRQ